MKFFKNLRTGNKILTGFILTALLYAVLSAMLLNIAVRNKAAAYTGVLILTALTVLIGFYLSNYISRRLKELKTAAERIAEGDLNFDYSSSEDEIGQVIKSLKEISDNTKYHAEIVKQLAEGRVNIEIVPKSEKDVLSIQLLNINSSLKKQFELLTAEAKKLALGDIQIRSDYSFTGEMGELFNSFNEIAQYIKCKTDEITQIAEGNFSVEICKKSEKDIVSRELLNLIDEINSIYSEMSRFIQAAKEGDLSLRADEKLYKGDWSSLIAAQNDLVDVFVYHINIMKEYLDGISKGVMLDKITETKSGEWEKISLSINGVLSNLQNMFDDVNRLVEAGSVGDLRQKADTEKHSGGFKKIVNGINILLDEIIKPIIEFEEVLAEMAKGSLQVCVKGDYKGEMAAMKDDLNHLINGVYDHIEETSKVLNEMAKGNLNVEIKGNYNGDYKDLKEATNKIIRSFNETLGDIDNAAGQVSAAAKQVSDSSQALSQGATEQAASLEEITSSVTEIAAQTNDNAANANKASSMAESVKESADKGNKHMQSVLKAMEDINMSSNNISKVIKVIDDIAFQTNILALNAAVEAARAGQYGKGFAVVADEVRDLAARSAKAAKETTVMIEESISKARDGKKITETTALELNKVTESIDNVTELVSEIAKASSEQATAISQINQAIEEVSAVTQTNTATSEESASASEELSGQAVLVKERVDRFKLKKVKSREELRNLDDKTLKMIEDIIANIDNSGENAAAYKQEAEAIQPKMSICLDDSEFGKY